MRLPVIWTLLKDTAAAWQANKAQRLAAALAYYTMFSLAPLLLLLIALAGLAFGEKVAEGQIMMEIEALIGAEGTRAIRTLLTSVRTPLPDPITALIGGIALLFGASALFNHLKDSLNTIWGVARKPGHAVRGFLIDRCLAFGMVLTSGFVLLVSLVISAGLARFGTALAALLAGIPSSFVVNVIHALVSWAVITLLFALLYKVLPDTTIAWRDVWIGAAMTAGLFVGGQALIGLYLGSSQLGSAYGVAGALVIILVWVYYSALILFFGAEFTWVYANRYGSRVVPAPHAIALTPQDRALQGLLHADEIAAVAREQERL
jgi:membrane protein